MSDTNLEPGSIAEPGVGNALRQGWQTLKRNFWTLVGITLVLLVAQMLGSAFTAEAGPGSALGALDGILATVGGLYSVLFLAPLSVGAYLAFLHAVRGREPAFDDLLAGFRRYVDVVVGMFLVSVIVAVGFVLLVVPGVIAFVRLSFTPLLLVDREMGPVEAIKASWEHTRGYGWSLFGLALAGLAIVAVGFLALLVGALVAIPWVLAAYAAYYHDVLDRPTTPAEDEPAAPAGAVGA